MLLIAKKYFNKLNFLNAHIIYFTCIFIALAITVFIFYNVNLLDGIEVLGTFIQIALPCYVLVPILVKKDLQGAKQMLLLLTLVLIVTYTLKIALPFKRPYGGSMSFPSGHTVGAFCGAVFLGFRYGKKYLFISMLFAIFVAFSRVYSQNHWPTDVYASILLCFLIGMFTVKKYS
ncbi:MAG: phosphatase PAP2 family protein [Bdellovibrionota bacterium]